MWSMSDNAPDKVLQCDLRVAAVFFIQESGCVVCGAIERRCPPLTNRSKHVGAIVGSTTQLNQRGLAPITAAKTTRAWLGSCPGPFH